MISPVSAVDVNDIDLTTGNISNENTSVNNNQALKAIQDKNIFWGISNGGERWARNMLIQVAKSLKNIFLIVATLYMIFIVFKLIFAGNTSEQVEKFKQWILWSIIWIIVMQISYIYVTSIYGSDIWWWTVFRLIEGVIHPVTQFLETLASFIFIAIIIFAYFKIVTAAGDEEKIKSWKMSVFYAIIGFIIIRFSKVLVDGIYGRINCRDVDVWIISAVSNSCTRTADLWEAANIAVTIIDWVNGFVGIIIVIMIIFAGFQLIFGWWDEEKINQAKRSILYIAIGLLILISSYLILTFFIEPSLNNTL